MKKIADQITSLLNTLSRRLFSDSRYTMAAVLLFTLLIRLCTVQIIDDAGDSKFYMNHVRQLISDPSSYEFNHWSSRFAIIIPVCLVRLATGGTAIGAYVLPLLFSLLSVFLVMKLSMLLYKSEAGFIAAILIAVYPDMVREGSQILPGIFSMVYLLASIYLISVYIFKQDKSILYVVFSAIFMFLGYGTHIINLFFAPGIILLIFLKCEKPWRVFIIFSGILFLLFLAETTAYHFFTGYSLGRLDVIRASHLSGNKSLRAIAPWKLLYRFVRPGPAFIILFAGSLYYGIRCIRKRNYPLLVPYLPAAVFSLFMLFAVKSINPVIPALPMNLRYFDASIPMFSLFFSFFIMSLLIPRFTMERIRTGIIFTAILIIIITTAVFHKNIFSNGIARAYAADKEIDRAISAGIPMIYHPADAQSAHIATESLSGGTDRKKLKKNDRLFEIFEEVGRIKKNVTHLNAFYADSNIRLNTELLYTHQDHHPLLICVPQRKASPENREEYFTNTRNRLLLLRRRPLRVKEISVKDYFEMQSQTTLR